MMTSLMAVTAAAVATVAAPPMPPPAAAEDRTGAVLGECIVLKSTGADRLAVARWLLGSLASAPQVADIASVQPAKKDAADRVMATLFTRLIAKDCAAEARAAFAVRGNTTAAFEIAGEALGRVAMTELLGNPAAQAGITAYVKYLDETEFSGVTKPQTQK